MSYGSRGMLITALVVLALVFIVGYLMTSLGITALLMGFTPYGFLWMPIMLAIFIIVIVLAVYAIVRSVSPTRRST